MPADNNHFPPDAPPAMAPSDLCQTSRGKLKIFFDTSTGADKTRTMLQAARQQQAQGVDVLIGLVETHQMANEQHLLDGLEQLAPSRIQHLDGVHTEFDLDAALKRHAQLVVLDDLTHSNTNSRRHSQRNQDVETLLAAGIDVYITI